MNLTKYDIILENCGARTCYEPNLFNDLLRKYAFNWKKIILKRHHQFVESYLKNKGNINLISKELKYAIVDLKSILLRIQSQFELYDEDDSLTFMDMVVNIQGLPIIAGDLDFSQFINEKKKLLKKEEVLEELVGEEFDFETENITPLEIFVEEENKIEETSIDETIDETKKVEILDLKTVTSNIRKFLDNNPKAKRSEKLAKYIEEFNKVEDISVIEYAVTEKSYKTLIGLMNGKTLAQLSNELKSSENYLFYSVVGYNNARTRSELGIVKILETI